MMNYTAWNVSNTVLINGLPIGALAAAPVNFP